MQNTINGNSKPFDASNYKVGVVVAQFNKNFTSVMLNNCLVELKKYKIKEKNIKIIKVAGCVEIPVALQALAKTKKYNCLVALGAIIKGGTDHYHFVAKIVTDGILRAMLDYNLPIGFGVLTCVNTAQTKARLSIGAQAAQAALQTALQISQIS